MGDQERRCDVVRAGPWGICEVAVLPPQELTDQSLKATYTPFPAMKTYTPTLADRLAELENRPDIPADARKVIGEAVRVLDKKKWTAVEGYPFDKYPVKLRRV